MKPRKTELEQQRELFRVGLAVLTSGRVRLQFDDPRFFPMVQDARREIARQANLMGIGSAAWKAHSDAFTECFRLLDRD